VTAATLSSASAELRVALTRLVGRPAGVRSAPRLERPGAIGAIVSEVRSMLHRFQALEAAHVASGLADDAFPFDAAQVELLASRRDFAVVVHEIGQGLAALLAPGEQDELHRIALLAHAAPATTRADLDAIRATRARRLA
jgi:hypothetical protein